MSETNDSFKDNLKDGLKNAAHEGIDLLGRSLINLLPTDGAIKNALSLGLDKSTDLIFDRKKHDTVPLKEHSELEELADNLVPVVLQLVDQGVLKPVDFPFVEGEYELMFEEGLKLQLEALIRQAISNLFD